MITFNIHELPDNSMHLPNPRNFDLFRIDFPHLASRPIVAGGVYVVQ